MAISDMGIAQIREGLASKQFTACEVAQASLDRIAQADSQVHAFLEVTSEAAMAVAQRVDQAIADARSTRSARWPACRWRSRTT
mgnify:CR=1 FL=1